MHRKVEGSADDGGEIQRPGWARAVLPEMEGIENQERVIEQIDRLVGGRKPGGKIGGGEDQSDRKDRKRQRLRLPALHKDNTQRPDQGNEDDEEEDMGYEKDLRIEGLAAMHCGILAI